MIEKLIMLLNSVQDDDAKAVILQSYISQFGPIPDEYGDEVRKALSKE